MRHPLLFRSYMPHKTLSVFLLGAGLFLISSWLASAEISDVTDSDGDGLTDLEEARIYRTDPQFADTDTDGLADGLEVDEYWTLPLVVDTDGDQFIDGVEVRLGTDPTDISSFPTESTPGFNDLDGDGISNEEERSLGSDPQRVDSDFDGLDDFVEIRKYFTSPVLVDSDGDGAWDGEEVAANTSPVNSESTPSPRK